MESDMDNLRIVGDHDENTVAQMRRCMGVGSARYGVLCADGHLGYAQPVGGVIAYEDHVSISGVGFDIGCGNMAVMLDVTRQDLWHLEQHHAREVPKRISFGVGRSNAKRVEHAVFDSPSWKLAGIEDLKDLARNQLGTVGAGNHYVDLFTDDNQQVWIGVHFGSRGLGHTIATRFLKELGGKDGMDVDPTLVDVTSDIGTRYLLAMHLAGIYAYAGREWVVDQVRQVLGGQVVDMVHNHHNYAWSEKHYDRDLWVVRKGATPSAPGQRGFVGGSMGDDAFIIRGAANQDADLLASTIHGAGRKFGRKAAKKMFMPEQMQEWCRKRGVRVIGGDVDESPMAYKRIERVMEHHSDSVVIEHRLKPYMVFMAGANERDPYRD